jgi:hypothetical protein
MAVATPQAVVNALAGGQELNASPTTLTNGDYWVGNNGQVYVKSAGVQGAGGAAADDVGASNKALLADLGSYGAKEITNPGSSAPAATGGISSGDDSSSSSAATTPKATVNPGLISSILASIANEISTNQGNYQNAVNANAGDDATEANQVTTQNQGNTTSRAQSIQGAEQAAASGSKGLDAVLASLGALNGTGSVLAGRAVASTANSDIGGADATYQTNATNISNADAAYQAAAKQRNTTLTNNLTADNQDATHTGDQNIINDAEDIGDTATINKFLPGLTASTAPAVQLAPTQLSYNAAPVSSYAPASGLTVTSAPTGGSNAASTTAAQNAVTPVNSALYVNKNSNTTS